MILQSFARLALRLPELKLENGNILPEVVIPKGRFLKRESGCPVIELTDLEVERIKVDPMAMAGFKPDLNGNKIYRWLSRMPEKYKGLDMKRISR